WGQPLQLCAPLAGLGLEPLDPLASGGEQLVGRLDRRHGEPGGAGHEGDAGPHDPAADDGRLRHDASLGGRSSLRRTKNVPVPVETGSPSASRIAVSRYATWRASRPTPP